MGLLSIRRAHRTRVMRHAEVRRTRLARATPLGLAILIFACLPAGADARAQGVTEPEVKAVYLLNFVRLTQWPADRPRDAITICLAGSNPFGDALYEAIRGEQVDGRPVVAQVIQKPEPGCDVLFVPRHASAEPFLAAARGMPTLTVGEDPAFLNQGGIIRFLHESGKVRFQIDAEAARRSDLRISSHLLNLSRGRSRG